MCRCIQTSVEVRAIILRSSSFLLSFVIEWISGDRTQQILWNSTLDYDAIFHNVTLQTSAMYTEILDRPEWGTLYFATPSSLTPSVSLNAIDLFLSSHSL